MSNLILPQTVYCDEAGFTGNNMLDTDQPMFTYASVAMDQTEARDLIVRIRQRHYIQARELKGAQLARSPAGRAVILETLQQMRGHYLVTAYDKKLSLACKFFEYVFEPVLARNNSLFYENDFHKFIATLVYITFRCNEEPVVEIITQFQRFMRSLNPQDAPIIFDGKTSDIDMREPLMDIAYFIDGYRDIILQESAHIGDWVLDLTISALWSHLANWGDRFDILDILCDDSKSLRDFAPVLDVLVNRPDKKRVTIRGKDRPVTFNMARPVKFGSSLEKPGLQLADVASSALLQARKHLSEEWAHSVLDEIEQHRHEDCILPDPSYMDLTTPGCAVNALILCELGQRAIEGRDPLYRIEEWYARGHSQVHDFLEAIG